MIFARPAQPFNRSLKFVSGLLCLLAFTAIITSEATAQNLYDVKGTVKKSRKKLEGAVITLHKGSTQVMQMTTAANGRFEVKMDLNAEYTLSISKAGHITKKFYFNTKGIPEDRAKEEFGGQDIEVSIFEMPKDPGVVSQINSILNQPMAKFYYDDKIKEIEYDKGYSQSVLDALAKLNQIEQEAIKKAEEEAKTKTAAESAAASKYEAAIIKGDAAFGKKDYTTARAAYTDALSIKPGEAYPKGKIIEIEKLLADAQKNAALEADYKAAVAKGDAAYAGKNYDAAKSSYNDALKLKPEEVYPKTKLDEIGKLLAEAAKNAELEAKYKTAIQKGDAAFSAKTYDGAKSAYNEALGLKPAEKYPKDKLSEIDKILADIAAKEGAEKELAAKYTAAIVKADKALAAKEYANAKTAYNEALALKAAEQYPKNKISEIDKILSDLAAKENSEKELAAKYAAAVAKGDKTLAAKDYTGSKAAFNEALGLKSAEQYPKDKIAEIDKILADLASKDAAEKDRLAKEKALEEKYKAAIAKGDAALGKKEYTAAKAGYNEALTLKSAEQYPKDKLAEIEKALADASRAAETETKYKAALAKADAAFKAKTYDAAKTAYNEALAIKSSEQYPKDKITEIDGLLAKDSAAKELNEKYTAAIAKADKAFAAKTFDVAKSGYNEALGFKPAEAYPKTKLAEIEKAIADAAAKDAAEKARLAKEKELEEKYKAAIAKGDASFGSKEYASAKTAFNEALSYKSTEKYPKDKITEIDGILAKEMGAKALEEKYKSAIAKADAAFGAKTYAAAKTAYTEALALKPNEQYPKDKIAEADKALAAEAAEKDRIAKEKQLEEKYKAAVAKGDAALKAKTYPAAKIAYNEALGVKASEQYPKDKIAEIDALIAKEMGAKELDEKYKAAVVKADAALKIKSYEDARAGYNDALGFKPAEAYPKTKLAEIDKILADAAAKDAAEQTRLAKEKELEEKYKAAIAKGDGAFGSKEYEPAKTAYNEALTYKSLEKYPKDKITEINAILAKEMGAKALEEKYKAAVAKGDAAFGTTMFAAAKTAYTEALALKPAEQYPKDKLAEVEKALADIAAANKGKELEAKYTAAIAKADAAFSAKTYTAAKTAYNEALGLKPGEKYPKDKIAEIDGLLANDAAEKARLAKEKELEAKYKAAIAKADAALKAKTYAAAKTAYNDALGIKDDQYPKDKIAEIDKLLAELANKDLAAKELNEKYTAAIMKADAAFAGKEYAAAKTAYNEALGLKPAEKYPKDKLAAIDALIAKDAGAKELEAKYKAAIAKADTEFNSKEYANAKASYTEASGIKPSEQYPKDQIAKVNGFLGDLAKNQAVQAKYDATISKADGLLDKKDYANAILTYRDAQLIKPNEPYPGNKIKEINAAIDAQARAKEKEKEYNEVIVKADKLFSLKDYRSAKSRYLDASLIKPTEQYPKDKVAEIDVLMKKKNNTTVTASNTNKDEFRSELAKKYPEGITEESATENNAKVTRRIVVRGAEGHMYVRKETSFGPIYFFKDDVPITEVEFLRDTEVQQ